MKLSVTVLNLTFQCTHFVFDGDELGQEFDGGDDRADVRLGDAVDDAVLAQVGVDGAHRNAGISYTK